MPNVARNEITDISMKMDRKFTTYDSNKSKHALSSKENNPTSANFGTKSNRRKESTSLNNDPSELASSQQSQNSHNNSAVMRSSYEKTSEVASVEPPEEIKIVTEETVDKPKTATTGKADK